MKKVFLLLILSWSVAALGQGISSPTGKGKTAVAEVDVVLDCPLPLMEQGKRAVEAGDLQTALNFYQRAVMDYPSSNCRGEALFNLGSVLYELKKFNEAINVFKEFLKPDVDLRFTSANSGIESFYYRYRGATYISLCYEQLGRFADAYHWLESAKTIYLNGGPWCGTCAQRGVHSIDREMDRVALAAGGWTAFHHITGVLGKVWYGWVMLSCWCLSVFVMVRKAPEKRPVFIYTTIAAVFAITLVVFIVNRDWMFMWHRPFLEYSVPFIMVFGWALSIAGLAVALFMHRKAPLAASKIAAVSMVAAALVQFGASATWILLQKLSMYTLYDFQMYFFCYFLLLLSISAGAATAVRRLSGSKNRIRGQSENVNRQTGNRNPYN